ncbi:Fe-S cluster-binding ribosome biosynthesis protein [Hypoxylon texense]
MSSKAPKTNVDNTTVPGDSYYTNLHLSAVASLYPPTPRNVKHMCESKLSPETQTEQSKLIRVYYTEPSYFGYNPGSYLIKETRYGVQQKWHAASDELVADDAAPGSPVAAVGWWVSSADGQGFEDTWERVNHSSFKPTTVDDFDAELHKPEELIPPTPGWKQTPLYSGGSNTKSDGTTFPIVSPLPTTKLTAIHFDTGYIYVFYQEVDASIHVLVSQPGQGWQVQSGEVVNSQVAKPGAPLSAIVGGWNEVRLFYVTPQDELGEAYMDSHTPWVKGE